MPIFEYKAINASKRSISGLIESGSESAAAATLKENGLSIIMIKKKSDEKKDSDLLFFLNKIKLKDVVIFSRQFSVMISANVALVQSLRILVNQTENLALKLVVSEIADEVDSGSRLSEALEKRPKIFSGFYVNVVKSGETSGKLDEVLNYLADEMEKDYDMMGKIKGAMIYPAFVFCGLGVVGTVMMIFVVPKLTGILSETGTSLPLATRLLIGVSAFLTSYWWVILITLIGLGVGFKFYMKKPAGRRQIDLMVLQLPVFGKLLQRIYLVRFTRSMNTLIMGGVSITKSLDIAADVVGNQTYRELIEKTSKEVEDGNSISSVFIKSDQIPKMVSQMMSIGEKTGKLDIILERITDFYTREINNIVANLMTLMEPIIMVIMGVAVGIMVAAIIMPMYNMAGSM